MDPNATLGELDKAMSCGDRPRVAELADALVGWIEKGGFLPVGPHGSDWRGKLSAGQFASHFRAVRAVAEMV